MRNMLLASVAAAGLALSIPAFAQDLSNAVPATPPITTEAPTTPDVGLAGEADAAIQTPEGSVQAETQTQAEAQANAETPGEAAEAASAMAASPAMPDAALTAETRAAPTVTAAAPAAAIPATANAVCQPRVTSVHFGARGSSLSQQNRNAIEQAVDAASVCDLQQVQIIDSANGSTSSRRASAVRATLVRQGVPEDRITVAETANADAEAASTGRLDVRMSFAGVADGGAPVAANAATPVQPNTTAPPAPESGS